MFMDRGLAFVILGVIIILGSVGTYLYGNHLKTVWTDETSEGNLQVIPDNYNPSEYSKGVTLKRGGILGIITGVWITSFGCYLMFIDKVQQRERIPKKSDSPND
jgi:hypothetical protein